MMITNPTLNSTTFVREQIKSAFTAQAKRPECLTEVKLNRLTPFQRALLVTDGTVTRFIEAYTLSPVEVVLLHQDKQTLYTAHRWLELPIGTKILERHVVLQTPSPSPSPSSIDRETQKPTIHAYAISQIVPQRLPKSILDGIESGVEGLGMLLKKSLMETRRNLLWWGVERGITLPNSIQHLKTKPLLTRTYNVIADKMPLMLITEKFPIDEPSTDNQ